MEQYFSIQKICFQVGFFSRQQAHELQNRISRLHYRQVAPLLDNFFARHIPADVLIKKDQLLLDLGVLHDEELEQELPGRLEKALEEFFQSFIHNHLTEWNAEHVEIESTASGYLHMLEHFLMTGTLPWQASSQHSYTWQMVLDAVCRQEPVRLQQLLRRLGRQHTVRARLAYQSAEEDMQKIITALEPAEAPVILSYRKNIEAVQREKQLVRSGSTEFSQAVSLFILTYLLGEKESEFSRKAFIKSMLQQMAAHYNIAYQDLIFVLLEAMPPLKTAVSTTNSLLYLIEELSREAEIPFSNMLPGAGMHPASTGQPVGGPSAGNTQQQALLLAGRLYVVRYYLQHGSLPPEQGAFSREELAGYLLELAGATPATVKDMIASLPGKTLVAQRLAAMLAKKEVIHIISLWLPQDALFIERWIVLLLQLPAENGPGVYAGRNETHVYTNVLDAVFTGAGQAFDRQGFIRLSMQLLSQQYRVKVPALAEALIAVTRSDHRTGSPYAGHAVMLANLAAVHETDIAPAGNVHHVASTDEHVEQQALTDVLVYFLQFGASPWWAGTYAGQSPEALLEMVYERSVQDAIHLLMKAGMQERMKRRWLLQFPDSLTEKICSHLSGWNRAQEALAAVIQLVQKLPFLTPATVQSFRPIALEAIWAGYIEEHYSSFDETCFYRTVLACLTALDEQVLPALPEAIRRIRTQHVSGVDALLLQQLPDQNIRLPGKGDDGSINTRPQQEKKNDSYISSAEGDVDTTAHDHSLQKVVQELLQQGSLPDQIRKFLLTYGWRFIGHLQQLSAAEQAPLMQQLAKHVVTGHTFLTAITGQASRFTYPRQQPAENNASQYSAFARLEQAIGQLVPAAAEMFGSTGVNAESLCYRNIDELIRQYAGIPEPAGVPVVNRLRLVENLLDYYLTWNRLPDGLPVMNGREADEQLEDLLLLLYQQNADGLKRLFSSEKHTAIARMRLHNLFAGKGGRHRKIAVWLESYWEKDAVRFLKEIATSGNFDEHELKPLLDQLLNKAKDNKKQIAVLLQLPAMARYIACHYDEEMLGWLIKNSSGASQEVSSQSLGVISLLVNGVPEPAGKARLRLLLYEFTLGCFSVKTSVKNIREYIQTLLIFLSRSGYASTPFLTGLFHNTSAGKGVVAVQKELLQHIRQELLQQLHIQQRDDAMKVQLEEQRRMEAAAAAAILQKRLQQELEQKQQEEARRKREHLSSGEKHKLYVANAGLVLLHPFLGTYFSRLNLVEKGLFVSPEAQARAVHLLQYLAYNTTQNPEHLLTLNKILCNYPLHEPLPPAITLEPHEVSLSAELLQVVIQRAGGLSSSTVDGFRVSFVHREGMITETAEAWTMRVEQRGYDMILQMLPWAFGMIKFSWMDKPLYVEWI